VLALCFTTHEEAFHHWKVFADGSSGVCIRFDPGAFLECLRKTPGIRVEPVKYQLIMQLEAGPPGVDGWPFLKRRAFRDEGELRVIYESHTEDEETKQIAFDLAFIKRITLSPWLPGAVADSIRSVIKLIDGCGTLPVLRSTLIENSRWKAAIDNPRRF